MVQLGGPHRHSAGRLLVNEPSFSFSQRPAAQGPLSLVLRAGKEAVSTAHARAAPYSRLLEWSGRYGLDVPPGLSELSVELHDGPTLLGEAIFDLGDPQHITGFHCAPLTGADSATLGEVSLLLDTEGDLHSIGRPEIRGHQAFHGSLLSQQHAGAGQLQGAHVSSSFSRGSAAGTTFRQGGKFETTLTGTAAAREQGLGVLLGGASPGGFRSFTNGSLGTGGARGAATEVCQRQTFTRTEDRPITIQRTEYIRVHRVFEKTFVTEVRFAGEREVGGGRTEVVGHEERVVEVAQPGPVCQGIGSLRVTAH